MQDYQKQGCRRCGAHTLIYHQYQSDARCETCGVWDSETREARWEIGTSEPFPEGRMRFLAQIGEYDIHYDTDIKSYTVIVDDTICEGSNFTDYILMANGNLEPVDRDVILDPYHMCLLYQLHEEIGRTLKL